MIKHLKLNIKKDGKINEFILEFFIFAVCFFINWILNFFINADFLTVIIFICFFANIYLKYTHILTKYFYLIFLQVSNFIGVFIVENFKIWLNELSRSSEHHNSLLLIAVVHWLFFYLIYVFDYKIMSENSYNKENKTYIKINNYNVTTIIFKIIGTVLFVVMVIALINAARHPAFSLKFSKFMYRKYYLIGIWRYVDALLFLSLPIIVLMYKNNLKKISIFFLLGYGIYLFLIGNKFGEFMTTIYLMMPLVKFDLIVHKRSIKKWIRYLVVALIAAIALVFIRNNLLYGKNIKDNIVYLFQRTAQQGQLWWAIYDKENNEGFHINELSDEYRTYFVLNDSIKSNYNYGIYKIMRMVTPSDIFYNKILSGSRYSAATYASIYYYFKKIGLLVAVIIFAYVYSRIVNWYNKSISNNKIIESVISGKFTILFLSVFTQADFDVLFSVGTIMYITILFVPRIISMKFTKRVLLSKETG